MTCTSLPPRALEIGCGIGRLLRPLAKRVAEAHGVDISEEMVRQAREALAVVPNAHVHHTNGDLRMFEDSSFDICLSALVFQHIASADAVELYIRETARVLRSGGIFRFQVATSESDGTRSRTGGTWFGVVFREDGIRILLDECGFDVTGVARADDALFTLAMFTARRR